MDRYIEKVITVSTWDKQVDKYVKALNCKTRRDILQLLVGEPRSIWNIAETLNVPLSTVSEHVNVLLKTGLVSVVRRVSDRGHGKIIALQYEKLQFDFHKEITRYNKTNYSVHIPIGSYSSFKIHELCGMLSAKGYLGARDDPNTFYCPLRSYAQLIWFDYGYLEYVIPLEEKERKNVESLSISAEVCSETPGYNETWTSDIFFEINGVETALYTSPGDFGARRGLYTPEWWNGGTQYGLLKKVEVNKNGCFLDGVPSSRVTLDDLKIAENPTVTFRIGVRENAVNRGGINLFGKEFGDYAQHIVLTVSHAVEE